jgi:ubiquinone/menaquinone biosynthesis C-methylase UbiE
MFAEIEIKPGDQILDFGCGPEIFTIMSAEKTGNSGKVYALDIHPLAAKMVEQKARQKKFGHIITILSDCDTSIIKSVGILGPRYTNNSIAIKLWSPGV